MDGQRERVDRLGDEIAEVAAHIDAATHRMLTKIRAFDDTRGWYVQGALTCAHWLSWRIGLSPGAAREKVRVARALTDLPRIDAALARGELSYSKVRALTRIATPKLEQVLIDLASHSTGAQLEKICRLYRSVDRQREAGRDALERRYVSARPTEDGMVRITAVLTADEAALVMKAIDTAAEDVSAERVSAESSTEGVSAERVSAERVSAESSAEGVSAEGKARGPAEHVSAERVSAEGEARGSAADISAERVSAEGEARRFAKRASAECEARTLDRADGLVAMAEAQVRGESPERAPVELVVTTPREGLASETLAEVGEIEGAPVPAETLRRFACDAGVVNVTVDERGDPLDVGRKTRTIGHRLPRALTLRDRGCAFPGCPNHRFVDGHHVVHWADGGETTLDNLVSLCRRHHQLVHEGGFRIEPAEDGFVFRDPDGRAVPASGRRPRAFAEALVREHAALGLGISATTNEPRWDGADPDYDACISGLVALR